MICQHESLLMLSEVDPAISLESIVTNAHYSFKCVLKALDYLAMRNMEHRDVRLIGLPIVSLIIPFHSVPLFSDFFVVLNILIHKTCSCSDSWCCVYPKEIKYRVMLADFDFITES